MPRGAKYSQSFRGGGQYDFSGRTLISASDANQKQTTDAGKSYVVQKTSVKTTVQSSEVARNVNATRAGFSVLIWSSSSTKYYFQYSAPLQFTFQSVPNKSFTEFSTTEIFDSAPNQTFTSPVSTETFQEDGVSSYEDGR